MGMSKRADGRETLGSRDAMAPRTSNEAENIQLLTRISARRKSLVLAVVGANCSKLEEKIENFAARSGGRNFGANRNYLGPVGVQSELFFLKPGKREFFEDRRSENVMRPCRLRP